MSDAEVIRVSPGWLALREPADAEARARDLAEALERALPVRGSTVIHDLGCGSGAMGRWLAPRLTGPDRTPSPSPPGPSTDLAPKSSSGPAPGASGPRTPP